MRLWKPWYVYRPAQVLRRSLTALRSPAPGYRSLPTSWGVPVCADPTRTIGRTILTTGVYDLAVSEMLARLIDPGDTVIDAGANVGYMTLLAAVAAGADGQILSFEPHPGLFEVLQQTVDDARSWLCIGNTHLRNAALGDRRGTAELSLPQDLSVNDGIARIVRTSDMSERTVAVDMETLDDALGARTASVLKMDVEGFELQVLSGATRVLHEKRVRHIIFEDHSIRQSGVVPMLRAMGYHLFSLGWSIRGIALASVGAGNLATQYEAPNFIASLDPDDVLARCGPRGWYVLDRGFQKRCRRRCQ